LTNLERGFKIHASAVNPLAVSMVAQTIDIEIARYDGGISAANLTGFLDTRNFHTALDDYAVTLPYISDSTANGADPLTGVAITGFKWWNFTCPTVVTSGSTAISTFESATGGSANFGGTAGIFPSAGESFATWNDPAAVNTWAISRTILLPSTVPLGAVATGYAAGSFTMVLPGGAFAVPVTLSTTSGSATLVYPVARTGNVVTITPVDITTAAGVTTITTDLVAAAPVKVFGVPQAGDSIKALAGKIHDFRNTKGLAMVQIRCLGRFETKNEAFACQNIPQQIVCFFQIFLIDRWSRSLISGRAAPMAERFC
jgi:hypothetical protein